MIYPLLLSYTYVLLVLMSRVAYVLFLMLSVVVYLPFCLFSLYHELIVQAQDAERQRQLEEESKLSAYELQKKREAEAEILQHESSKTAHYARLGATFVNRGSPLVGGAAGRGPVPTGRLGGRGSR